MKRFLSLAIICGFVFLSLRVQAQQGGSTKMSPAELHQLKQEIRLQRRAQRVDKQASQQAYQDNRRLAHQQRKQAHQAKKQQKKQITAEEAALLQRKYDKKFEQQQHQLQRQKKQASKELKDQKQLAQKREKNLERQTQLLKKKQKQNHVQSRRALAKNKKQLHKLEQDKKQAEKLEKKSYKVVKLASKAIPATAVLREKPAPTLTSSKAEYMRRLLKISPRIHYGVGNFRSSMTYDLPNLSNALGNTVNSLKEKYPWVPWKQVSVIPQEGTRTRTVRQQGKFFGTVGINLPVIFLEMEAGGGRFTQPAITFSDVWPPRELFQLEQLTNIMVERITQSKPQRTATLRVGVDAERLIPMAYLPRMEFKRAAIGLDASAYYLLGVDMSYRSGIELLGENAEEKLVESFGSIPLVSETVKMQAAQSIIRQMENSLPSYLWPPAMQGFGLVGKAYIDLGQDTRISLQYHLERSKGLSFTKGEFLQQGPALNRTFLTFGITTQL